MSYVGNERYALALTAQSAQTWTMTATPKAAQAGDGVILLNSQGQKCWTKGASTCALSGGIQLGRQIKSKFKTVDKQILIFLSQQR